LPLELALLIPGAIVLCIAVLRWPWLAGLVLVASVPAQQLGAFGGLTLTRGAIALSCAALVLWVTVGRRPIVVDRGIVLLGALLLAMIASAHASAEVGPAAADVVRWSFAFVALFCLTQFFGGGDHRRVLFLAATIVAATALEALYGMAQSFRAVGPASFLIDGGITRAFGTFGRPNTFAGFLEFGPFLGIVLGCWFGARALRDMRAYRLARLHGFAESSLERGDLLASGGLALAAFGCAGAAMLGILTSYSRGAWLGVACGLGVLALLLGPRSRACVIIAVPIALLIFAGGMANLLPGSLQERVGSISEVAGPFDASSATVTDENFAAVERMAHWQAGWRMFEDHPVLGVGAGNFNARYPDYYVREEFRFSQGHAHNVYIHILAESGLLGLLLYLTVLGYFAILALRVALFAPAGLARSIAVGCFATLVSLSVHNLFENLHVLNLSIMYSAIWCLVVAAHRMWRGTGTSASGQTRANMEYSGA
jgi:O-antigen ligase